MPTYEYKCDECGVVFERFQHFSEEPVKICPECSGPVRRVIHPVGIIFKGKGFYVTDNRGDTSALMPKAESKETKVAEVEPAGNTETKPTESKKTESAETPKTEPETKKETKKS